MNAFVKFILIGSDVRRLGQCLRIHSVTGVDEMGETIGLARLVVSIVLKTVKRYLDLYYTYGQGKYTPKYLLIVRASMPQLDASK